MPAVYPTETIETAKLLWMKKHSFSEIAAILNGPSTKTIRNWKDNNHWESLVSHETAEESSTRRYCLLVEKENKTEADYKELDFLTGQMEKIARIDQIKAKTLKIKRDVEDGNNNPESKSKKSKNKKTANDISSITKEDLDRIREKLFYGYQKTWYDAKGNRTRFILKSRQIGATYYFAWEAFEDAVLTGDNQIFLSASKAQAQIFKAYIMMFAKEYFDIDLKGEFILLSNGAELRFLSTNARTAQGYHGHLYVDEVFWMQSFSKVDSVASGISSQKKWRTTYFSTPSIDTHSAYPKWSGEWFNKARKRKKKIDFDISHDTLKDGRLCEDGIWRHIVTVKDAEEQGCNLFDINQLRNERPEQIFRNLFMCEFLKEGNSVFSLSSLIDCGVDSNVTWVDFKNKTKRPYGNKPVWLGYDPARKDDKSIIAVLAVPTKPGEKFRVLEWIRLTGSYPHQAKKVLELTEKYNVQYLGIDCTGPGIGVYETVKKSFHKARPINYNVGVKTELVLKGQDVIDGNRIEWDENDKDIPASFMQIRQTITKNSDQITYIADRSAETGHADVAWAVLHALHKDPLGGQRRKSNAA